MPKQVQDVSKGTRMHFVWRAVSRLGRASPEMVAGAVAQRIGVSSDDANFKRSIYRDLKHLSESGDLSVEYFTPDGAPVKPEEEDQFKNLRAEYFVSENQVRGGGLLHGAGGVLHLPRTKTVNWRVSETSGGLIEDSISLHFESVKGRFLTVSAGTEDLPFKLIIGRMQDQQSDDPALEEKFGLRAGRLLLSEKSVSREHAVIESTKESGKFLLRDLSSQNGTFWSAAKDDDQTKLISIASSEATVSQLDNPLALQRDWQKVAGNPMSITTPAFIRLGSLTFLFTGGH